MNSKLPAVFVLRCSSPVYFCTNSNNHPSPTYFISYNGMNKEHLYSDDSSGTDYVPEKEVEEFEYRHGRNTY